MLLKYIRTVFRLTILKLRGGFSTIDVRGDVIPLLDARWITQRVKPDGGTGVIVRLATYGRKNECSLDLVLHKQDGQVIGEKHLDGRFIADNTFYAFAINSGFSNHGGDIYLSIRSLDGRVGNHLGLWREQGLGAEFVIRSSPIFSGLGLPKVNGEEEHYVGGGIAIGFTGASKKLVYQRHLKFSLNAVYPKFLVLQTDRDGRDKPHTCPIFKDVQRNRVFSATVGNAWQHLRPDALLIDASVDEADARLEALAGHRIGIPVIQILEEDRPWECYADASISKELLYKEDLDINAELMERLSRALVPSISVLLPIWNVEEWGVAVLTAYYRQSYTGLLQFVFVGNMELRKAQSWLVEQMAVLEREQPELRSITYKFVFEETYSTQTAWHHGAIAADGDLLVLSDAGVVPMPGMLQAHVDSHSYRDCVLTIGPIAPIGALDFELLQESIDCGFRDELNLESFLNCRAGNIVLRKKSELLDAISLASKLPIPLDWQSVAIGFLVYQAGGRIKFNTDASVYRCDFGEFHEKTVSEQLAITTLNQLLPDFSAITLRWQRSIKDSNDFRCGGRFYEPRLPTYEAATGDMNKTTMLNSIKRPAQRSLRIITYRWHVPHQYELYKLPHQFDLLIGQGAPISDTWDFRQRPMPMNARFISLNEFKEENYDLAILHFDENVLSYENTNGHLGQEWGAGFRWFMENINLPKVAICHGTPQFYGQYNSSCDENDVMKIIETARGRLVDYLAEVEVVCNSYQAQREWGFVKSRVIWHGFDPTEFSPALYCKGILSPLGPLVTSRPHYRGYFLYKQVFNEYFPKEYLPEQLSVPDPHVDYSGNVFALAKYHNYINELRNYSIYFNPTLRSPMPRARAEPMMCGVVTVNANNHDVDMFIKNGVNGFYSNDPDELREQLIYLMSHPEVTRRMGGEARKTAISVFNHERYLADWTKLLNSVV